MDSFVHIQGDPNSELAPLILIHAVSGLALPYFALGSLTGEMEVDGGRPVYGISSPIYSSSSYRLPKSIDSLAQEYITMIVRHLQYDGPLILGGWSFGGMIAMKMARLMRAQKLQVLRVIMIDSANPDRYPAFTDKHEHKAIAIATYNPIKQRVLPLAGLSTNEEESSPSSDEEDSEMSNILPKLYHHIHNGLELISRKDAKTHKSHHCRTPVSLIKCELLEPLPKAIKEPRRKVMKKRFEDSRMGWDKNEFEEFETIPFCGSHDGAFDPKYVGELTYLMRGILSRCW